MSTVLCGICIRYCFLSMKVLKFLNIYFLLNYVVAVLHLAFHCCTTSQFTVFFLHTSNIPASYSGGRDFKFRPGDWLS
jgi:hypothetical protein